MEEGDDDGEKPDDTKGKDAKVRPMEWVACGEPTIADLPWGQVPFGEFIWESDKTTVAEDKLKLSVGTFACKVYTRTEEVEAPPAPAPEEEDEGDEPSDDDNEDKDGAKPTSKAGGGEDPVAKAAPKPAAPTKTKICTKVFYAKDKPGVALRAEQYVNDMTKPAFTSEVIEMGCAAPAVKEGVKAPAAK